MLTLSMIVKNEERYLSDCLDSVKNLVDEIIIVDTGSIDNTVTIAKNHNAKIYYYEWSDDFSAARNFALSKSSGDWILYLDADERLVENSKKEINKLIVSKAKIGVYCTVSSSSASGTLSQKMKYIRLFKKSPDIFFSGKAHEQIEPSLKENSYKFLNSNIEITHLGYDTSYDSLKEKAKRNLKLMFDDYKENKNSYLAYQIANSYAVLKDEDAKIEYYKEALLDRYLNKELRSVCLSELADFELRKDNLIKAKEYIDIALTENSEQVILKMIASQVYGRLKNYEKALNLCKEAFDQNSKILLNRDNFALQQVSLSPEKILYQSILLSIQSSNDKSFLFFTDKLSTLNQKETLLYLKLFNNRILDNKEIEQLVELSNNGNIELIINLFLNYHHENKLDYFRKSYLKFKENPQFISFFSSFLISINKHSDAQEVLESASKEKINTLPIMMYLTSIYIQTNQYDKLICFFEELENMSKMDLTLSGKLAPLKNKIMPILQKIM